MTGLQSAAARVLAAVFLALTGQPVLAETVTVAVAANFREPLRVIAGLFEAGFPHQVRIVSGSSGAHYSQIMAGAPYDLFLSADSERPAELVRQGRVAPAAVKTYALGKLVAWMPGASSPAQVEQALRGWEGRLALSNPRLAPYGRAAMETMESMKLQSIATDSSRLVRGENVGQTYQFVVTGNVGLGFVALSQVLDRPRAEYWIVPETLYQPIVQQLAILRDTAGVRALVAFLATPEAREVLTRYGYGLSPGLETEE